MADAVICLCAQVTEAAIRRAATSHPDDLRAVCEVTGACAHCGDCLSDMEDLMAEVHAEETRRAGGGGAGVRARRRGVTGCGARLAAQPSPDALDPRGRR
jgi:bacterioferritin-associated ferredoxin